MGNVVSMFAAAEPWLTKQQLAGHYEGVIRKAPQHRAGLRTRQNYQRTSALQKTSICRASKNRCQNRVAERWFSTTVTTQQPSSRPLTRALSCTQTKEEDMRRNMIAAIAAAVTLTPATAEAARKSSCANSPEKAVRACIWHAAKKYEVSYDTLLRKARCESDLNPSATNGTHIGLFQFLPSTWDTTPYKRRDPWRAKWNALGAAWMHSVGRGGEWTCQ